MPETAQKRARDLALSGMDYLHDWWGGANLSDEALPEVLAALIHELRRMSNCIAKALVVLERGNDDGGNLQP